MEIEKFTKVFSKLGLLNRREEFILWRDLIDKIND